MAKKFFTTIYSEPDNVIEKANKKLKEKVLNQTPVLMVNTTRTEDNWRNYSKSIDFDGSYYIIDMGIDKVKYRDLITETFAPVKRKGFAYYVQVLDEEQGMFGSFATYAEALRESQRYCISTGKETAIHAIKEGSNIVLTRITPKTKQDKGQYKIEIHKYLIFGGYSDDFIQ